MDAEDVAFVGQWTWYRGCDGYVVRKARAHEGRKTKTIFLHRELLDISEDGSRVSDHISRDRMDNRRSNLRAVSKGENNQNMPARGGSSEYRGVTWVPRLQKWRAKAKFQGKSYHGGVFVAELDAARAARDLRNRIMTHNVEAVIA